jgi:hypothetical protein
MKNLNKYFAIFPMAVVIAMGVSSCAKHDQVLDLTPPADVTPVLNTSVLTSVPGTATLQPIGDPHTPWDGTIEAVWNNASKLTVNAVVPDLGNNTFEGFVGNSTDITMRSMYDANNIYFLMEFNTPQHNAMSAQWYFNSAQTDMTKRWAQEATASSLTNLSPDGSYRPPFAQDQFVMMWNIANSCQTFNALSCYAACHKMSSYGGTTTPDGGVMYTNGPTERLDVWRARMLQGMNTNQANDCFIDDGSSIGTGYSGVLDKNQVHGDWQVLNGPSSSVPASLQSPGHLVSAPGATNVFAADGGFGNKQTLKISLPGGGFVSPTKKANVPIWVIPAALGTNPYTNSTRSSAIMLSDTLSGLAKKVISVDSFGVLTLADLSTIDPRTAASGANYQQVGAGDGANCIPGSIIGTYTGSRGDVTVNAFYTGTGWRMLFKRAMAPSDNTNDVDFSSHQDLPFGVGAMFNKADNQHAIVAGLTLHFQ